MPHPDPVSTRAHRTAPPVADLPGGAAPEDLPIDGVLLVSFGGPRGPAEVMPFLERVTAGRGIPRARLLEVAEHYNARGGVSPINAETAAQARALGAALARQAGRPVPVFTGNRNWTPGIGDALRAAAQAGCRHLAVLLTSAYPGYSGCRQYRENVAAALAELPGGLRAPALSFVPPWGLGDPVVQAWTRLTVQSLRRLAASSPHALGAIAPHIVFVAHSVPMPAAITAGPPQAPGAYVRELRELSGQVIAGVSESAGLRPDWSLAYCSRSGRPGSPWLEPDICDELAALAARGVRAVAAIPIGFVADHMEVVEDLDSEAAGVAAGLGIAWDRAPTLRDDAQVAGYLAGLARAAGRSPGFCQRGCCPPAGPGAAARPAAFEQEAGPGC